MESTPISNTEYNCNRLIDLLRVSGKNYDIEKIKAAYEYASELHQGQFRQSGEPYISHPLAVAEIVAGLGLYLRGPSSRYGGGLL